MENDDIRRRRPEDEVIGSANIGGEGEFEDDELEDEEFDEENS